MLVARPIMNSNNRSAPYCGLNQFSTTAHIVSRFG